MRKLNSNFKSYSNIKNSLQIHQRYRKECILIIFQSFQVRNKSSKRKRLRSIIKNSQTKYYKYLLRIIYSIQTQLQRKIFSPFPLLIVQLFQLHNAKHRELLLGFKINRILRRINNLFEHLVKQFLLPKIAAK